MRQLWGRSVRKEEVFATINDTLCRDGDVLLVSLKCFSFIVAHLKCKCRENALSLVPTWRAFHDKDFRAAFLPFAPVPSSVASSFGSVDRFRRTERHERG